jgi:outer membrane lipoprotein-sorting protein
MKCLSTAQLVDLVLAEQLGTKLPRDAEHSSRCRACTSRLAEVREQIGRVAIAVSWESADAVVRRQLLSSLTDASSERVSALPSRARSINLNRVPSRFWITATAAALIVVGLYIAWGEWGLSSAPAQTAEALQGVKSYRCAISMLPGPSETGFCFWDAAGSVRNETYKAGKLAYISVDFKDKPGLSVDYQNESYYQLPPARGKSSPLLLMDMARFRDQADRVLPERKIGTQTVKGFEVSLRRIDPNAGEGTLRVWPDSKNKLPLRVEIDSLGHTTVFEDFVWNVPTDKWFDVKPPANFKDATKRFSVEEQTEQIVNSLKTYAKYCEGKYPSSEDRLWRCS